MGKFVKSVLEINLGRVSQNYHILKNYLGKTSCGASIKADAYGIGMVPVAKRLFKEGCEHFFVANIDEALECRKSLSNEEVYLLSNSYAHNMQKVVNEVVSGLNSFERHTLNPIKTEIQVECNDEQVIDINDLAHPKTEQSIPKIYILHGINCIEEAKAAHNMNLIPIISDLFQLEVWNSYAENVGEKLPAILHFETGLGRLAIQKSEVLRILSNPELISNINISYIMSHLACSDEINHELNKQQLEEMHNYQRLFKGIPISFANSGGVLLGKEYHFDLVRPGAALYGINSTHEKKNPFMQVITLKGAVLQKKILEQDQTIGYGATVNAKKGDKIITVEAGYADGYFRKLSNLGKGCYNNKILPQMGIVSMDMVIFNANNLTDEEFNEIKYVELLGDNITVNEVADYAGTVGYEVLTSLGNRYKKVYMD